MLDAIGWHPTRSDAPVEVEITAGHVAQLRHLRRDHAEAIVDRLERRTAFDAEDGISADVDAEIRRLRAAASGLGELLRRYAFAPK